LKDLTHLRRASGGPARHARSSKEPDGSLLTSGDVWKRKPASGHISHRPQSQAQLDSSPAAGSGDRPPLQSH
jgi:hypothetical protein